MLEAYGARLRVGDREFRWNGSAWEAVRPRRPESARIRRPPIPNPDGRVEAVMGMVIEGGNYCSCPNCTAGWRGL